MGLPIHWNQYSLYKVLGTKGYRYSVFINTEVECFNITINLIITYTFWTVVLYVGLNRGNVFTKK